MKPSISNNRTTIAAVAEARQLAVAFLVAVVTLQKLISIAKAMPTSASSIDTFNATPLEDPARPLIHYRFDKRTEPYMQVHKFESATAFGSNNVTCNDGTQAGYYKRLNIHSKSWIIYLQGGGYCGNEGACQQRWQRTPHLMSSRYWPRSKSVDGILSGEAKDNPYLWNANHIYVPYCSSDSWTGSQSLPDSSFTFMGARILEQVLESLFEELPRESSLYEAKFILLAGDSAGATGVILNLDKVNKLVHTKFSNANLNCSQDKDQICEQRQPPIFRGLADSGWFIDNEPYNDYGQLQQQHPPLNENEEADCERQRCTPLQSIKQAMLYWNGQVPASCAIRYAAEPWRCYFGYRTYQTLKTPLFVVQWLYDEAQLMFDNIVRPDNTGQWNYINKMVNEVRTSLENVTALFAPSCFSHSLIIKQTWNQININGLKLPHLLNSWEEEPLTSQPTFEALQAQQERQNAPPSNHLNRQVGDNLESNRFHTERQSNIELRHATSPSLHKTSSSRPKTRKRKRNNSNHVARSTSGSTSTNRLSRSTIVDDTSVLLGNNFPEIFILPIPSKATDSTDKFRLIDSCGWPQCNRDCPLLEPDPVQRAVLASH